MKKAIVISLVALLFNSSNVFAQTLPTPPTSPARRRSPTTVRARRGHASAGTPHRATADLVQSEALRVRAARAHTGPSYSAGCLPPKTGDVPARQLVRLQRA